MADTTTGNVTVCRSSAASGTFKKGSELPGSQAGSLSAVSMLTCSGMAIFNSGDPAALGATYTVTPKQAITSP